MNSPNSILFFKEMKRRSTITSAKLKSSEERMSSNARNSEIASSLKSSKSKAGDVDLENLPSDQKLEVLNYL